MGKLDFAFKNNKTLKTNTMNTIRILLILCYFSFGFTLYLNSQSTIKKAFNSISSSKIVKDLVNEMRTKTDLSEVIENNELNQAAAYHGIYLYNLLPYFNSKMDYTNYNKRLIDGTPQTHFETMDVKGYTEILTATGRAAHFTKGDTLVLECAQVLFSMSPISESDAQRIFVNYMNSPSHRAGLLTNKMLKSINRKGEKNYVGVKEIGVSTFEVELSNSNDFNYMYVNVVIIR